MSTDREIIADRRIESAVRHARESNHHLFVAGYQAAKVYGLHKEYATNAIAEQAGRSRVAVQNWVYAYRCFATCLQVDLQLAKKLRRSLTMTHFARMYAIAEKNHMTAEQQCYFLSLMEANKAAGEPYGPDALEQEIDVDMRYAGMKPDQGADWRFFWNKARKPLEQMASFDGELPAEVKKHVMALLSYFDEKYYDVIHS